MTGTPVGTILTSRSIPPTGGATSDIVRPARRSPVAWTVRRERTLRQPGGRHRDAAVGQARHGHGRRRDRTADANDDQQQAARSEPAALHRFLRIISAAGLRVATLSPGATPDSTIASSLPRRGDLNRLLDELAAVELVDDRVAVALEDRLGGDEHHVGHAIGGDAGDGAHARADPGIDLGEHQSELEVARRRPAGGVVHLRQDRDPLDGRLELPARNRLDPDRRLLPDLQPAAIRFVEPRFEMDRREIGQLHDRRARPGAIALVELDLLAAPRPAGAVVGQDVDHPGGRRAQLQVLDAALGPLQVEQGLLALALLARQVRFVRR